MALVSIYLLFPIIQLTLPLIYFISSFLLHHDMPLKNNFMFLFGHIQKTKMKAICYKSS